MTSENVSERKESSGDPISLSTRIKRRRRAESIRVTLSLRVVTFCSKRIENLSVSSGRSTLENLRRVDRIIRYRWTVNPCAILRDSERGTWSRENCVECANNLLDFGVPFKIQCYECCHSPVESDNEGNAIIRTPSSLNIIQ